MLSRDHGMFRVDGHIQHKLPSIMLQTCGSSGLSFVQLGVAYQAVHPAGNTPHTDVPYKLVIYMLLEAPMLLVVFHPTP